MFFGFCCCIENYPQILPLKMILSPIFCGSEIWVWLGWAPVTQSLSWGCTKGVVPSEDSTGGRAWGQLDVFLSSLIWLLAAFTYSQALDRRPQFLADS